VVPALLSTPWAGAEGLGAAAAVLAALDSEQRQRARVTFDAAALHGALRWVDGGAVPYRALVAHALYADLLVLGQANDNDASSGALPPDLVPALLSDTGTPALVVPWAGNFDGAAASVLIAWKPTREAARALHAALPWLRKASAVHVARAPEADEDELDHDAALRHWLHLQGVAAPVRGHRLAVGNLAEDLLSLAADTDADLLVMGCYGHSRTREWVLGGASRSILRSMTLPVLMAH
jgi:nucleotide-binding universal stress UspA family protein